MTRTSRSRRTFPYLVRWFVVLGVLAGAAVAERDALSVFREQRRAHARRAAQFWDGFRKRHVAAQAAFTKPYHAMVAAMNRDGAGAVDLRVDHSGYQALFDDGATLERDGAAAYAQLASSGHEKALATLFGALLELGGAIDAAERDLADLPAGAGGWGYQDQAAAVRRHGLAVHEAALPAALGRTPGAAVFLATKGYERAARADRKRSHVRRVLVLDALRAAPALAARPFLEALLADPDVPVRIAAAEALAAYGPATIPVCAPLLADAALPVRRATLALAGDDTRWIGPIVRALPATTRPFRHECCAVLRRLSKRALGADPEAWRLWYEANRPAADAGKAFDADGATAGARDGAAFYGIPLDGARVVFALDGTYNTLVPAAYDVQKTRSYHDWTVGNPDWKKTHAAHGAVQQRELLGALAKMAPETRFGLLTVKESSATKSLGAPRLLAPDKHGRRRARRFVEKHAPRGYRGEFDQIRTALDLAPDIDTIVLVSDGSARGGAFMAPRASLAAIRRLHRFRRPVIHTVRLCHAGAEAERLMQGIAAATGGGYRWAR